MAINIFQGGKPSKSSRSSSTANSVRAQNAKAALVTPSVTSDTGSTAVGKTGTLSKVGNVVGKVAGIASKFLPGIGGTIAKGIANIFNDPEWWRSVPGDAVTLNQPLRMSVVQKAPTNNRHNLAKYRMTMAEFTHVTPAAISPLTWSDPYVLFPTAQQITQYLMPEVRKVINAIPLQTAADYTIALQVNATLYALWQNLKKFDYILKHGQTYLANLNDEAFPILQVENAASLQSMIGRLEEYLRANVRLPHTLCEYLAWRFGRVYKSNTSAKSGLILYNLITMAAPISYYSDLASTLMQTIAGSSAYQLANADLYNAYYDHDFNVEIRDDTQFCYDVKEFCLRTNLDLVPGTGPVLADNEELDCVYEDSAMDNPTTYMASTVSTVGTDGGGNASCLIPVRLLTAYIPGEANWLNQTILNDPSTTNPNTTMFTKVSTNSNWYYRAIAATFPVAGTSTYTAPQLMIVLADAAVLKALDIYNKDIYVPHYTASVTLTPVNDFALDLSALSMDMGLVQSTTLGNEHVYAFANLVAVSRKHSMSYKEAETLVSRDVANLVEKLDVATVR